MKGPAASESIRWSLYGHGIRRSINIMDVLLVIYKKTCIALNWFIWEWLLGLFLIVRGLVVSAWTSIWLLLLILLWYFVLLSYHVFLWLSIGCCDISHLLSNYGFLKVMIHNFLFLWLLLLFVIVEGLMHPADHVTNRLLLLAREELFLGHIVRLHGACCSSILVGACPRTRTHSGTVIISCIIVAIYEEFWLRRRCTDNNFSTRMLLSLMDYFFNDRSQRRTQGLLNATIFDLLSWGVTGTWDKLKNVVTFVGCTAHQLFLHVEPASVLWGLHLLLRLLLLLGDHLGSTRVRLNGFIEKATCRLVEVIPTALLGREKLRVIRRSRTIRSPIFLLDVKVNGAV